MFFRVAQRRRKHRDRHQLGSVCFRGGNSFLRACLNIDNIVGSSRKRGIRNIRDRQGCLTLAITNIPDSPLARTADYVVDIQDGTEKAVAATKTYTAQLMAIAMLSAALSNSEEHWNELANVPQWAEQALAFDQSIARMSERFRYMSQCVVLGRGFNYATAFEWALKLKELTYVIADPYSSADFQHGPIAMV